ncbi:hypothetical protein MPTK1_3g09470 [Marchantia polymorpha subsp. ruderalis]|uniref:Uncharacterized protein n=2 Tax=Marchantia polymorpha TaxID=3197 RepID=A0AAF6AZ22_MARPO|nr:hypothetical protein MARPO_0085s0080 [Marchantia polymorpha]BBN05006.1 hypothetical protein Mp_3g09470 [Marchantia polymorpha subsp. ruderalis]|eukprot:PTQ33870.1 hypothetical protein MARPO_0085s0080 [Marchantia polymorpha]
MRSCEPSVPRNPKDMEFHLCARPLHAMITSVRAHEGPQTTTATGPAHFHLPARSCHTLSISPSATTTVETVPPPSHTYVCTPIRATPSPLQPPESLQPPPCERILSAFSICMHAIVTGQFVAILDIRRVEVQLWDIYQLAVPCY